MIWKDIEGYEGLYQISENGQVKSLARSTPRRRFLEERIMKQSISLGYPVVTLCKDNVKRLTFVHRLIARAFIDNPNNLPVINHKNGNKTDNRLGNLEWCDNGHNIRHAFENGLNKKGLEKPSAIILLHPETGIYYSVKDAAELIGMKMRTLFWRLERKRYKPFIAA